MGKSRPNTVKTVDPSGVIVVCTNGHDVTCCPSDGSIIVTKGK